MLKLWLVNLLVRQAHTLINYLGDDLTLTLLAIYLGDETYDHTLISTIGDMILTCARYDAVYLIFKRLIAWPAR